MSEKICENDKCTGCSACASVCPIDCIRMKADNEGFLRPVIDESRCLHCGKCQKICPVIIPIEDDGIHPKSYAARSKDKEVVAHSSSGGLFTVFASCVLRRGGVVIAAGFDTDYTVVHKVCADVNRLDELRRSKYVQSRIGSAYCEAKEKLDNGKEVLFCGTPCQIGGLKSYLGKDYSSLYTVDFVCHGTPSPLAYNRYLDYLRERYKSEICSVNFRNKSRGWHTHSLCVQFANGTEHNESVKDDYYERSFIMNMNLRPSCYQCVFKQVHRVSDITMADFWGSEQSVPDWNEDTGISLIMVQSTKGMELFNNCEERIEWIEVDYAEAVRSNPSMTCSVKKPPLRDSFMKDVNKLSYDKLHAKYCGVSLTSRARRALARFKLRLR